jgi:stage V sporulation protein S
LVWHVERIGGPYGQVLRGFCTVDRFFSKLDLRDIKIDPFNASYPPDAEEVVEADTEHGVETEVAAQQPGAARQPHMPAWATATEVAPDDEYEDEDEDEDVQPYANGGLVNGAVAATDGAALVEHRNGDVLKVSARSRPSAVAGAIAGVVRENGRAEVQAIGAGATNQAVKAVAIARDYLRETGIEAICLPAFIDVIIENEDRTAIRLVVEPR